MPPKWLIHRLVIGSAKITAKKSKKYLFKQEKVSESEAVPVYYRVSLMFLVVIHFVIAYAIEEIISTSKWVHRLLNVLRRKKLPKSKFKRLEIEIQTRNSWITSSTI